MNARSCISILGQEDVASECHVAQNFKGSREDRKLSEFGKKVNVYLTGSAQLKEEHPYSTLHTS